jgi:hypothetical protein
VVQGHHRDDEVEALVWDRPGGQVQVPDVRVGDDPGVDLGAHDVAHPGRRVGHRDGADSVAQGLGDQAGAGPVLEHPRRTVERDGGADGTRDRLGTIDLGGSASHVGGLVVEAVGGHRLPFRSACRGPYTEDVLRSARTPGTDRWRTAMHRRAPGPEPSPRLRALGKPPVRDLVAVRADHASLGFDRRASRSRRTVAISASSSAR